MLFHGVHLRLPERLPVPRSSLTLHLPSFPFRTPIFDPAPLHRHESTVDGRLCLPRQMSAISGSCCTAVALSRIIHRRARTTPTDWPVGLLYRRMRCCEGGTNGDSHIHMREPSNQPPSTRAGNGKNRSGIAEPELIDGSVR